MGVVLGSASGFFGAEVWRQILKLHPNPPRVDFKNYYKQLIFAHVVFGVFCTGWLRVTGNVIVQSAVSRPSF
jgi:hypothetical protein